MTTCNLKILGIDPGTATTGWAILEVRKNNVIPLAYGTIITKKGTPDEERLFEISQDLEKIIEKYKPSEAAIEKIFFFKNQKTIVQVSEARGALLLTLHRKKIKIASYTPLEVKQALTGYGRAEKKQIQEIVKQVLKLKSIPRPDDTADAIALAFCHLNSRKIKSLHKLTK